MYVMYIHIKAVTYVTFPNKQVDQTEVQEKLSNTCIFLLYAPIMFVMYLSNLSNSIWLWTILVEKCRKKPSLPFEKRITKTQELWANIWCHKALCIAILMIYGIINLHNHLYFIRYLYVLPSPVVFHFH